MCSKPESESPNSKFSQEQIDLFEKRYEEGYNIFDTDYNEWLQLTLPDSISPTCKSDTDSLKTHVSNSSSLSDVLVLPEPKPKFKNKEKAGINTQAICLSDSPVLKQLKDKEREKIALEQEKIKKKQECEERKQQRLKEKEEKRAKLEEKRKQRLREKEEKMAGSRKQVGRKKRNHNTCTYI